MAQTLTQDDPNAMGGLEWDIKCVTRGGAVTVLTEGDAEIAWTVTRATS